MKLSDIDPSEVTLKSAPPSAQPLKLSDFHPDDVQLKSGPDESTPVNSPVTAATTGLLNLGGWGPVIGGATKTGMDLATGGIDLDDLVDSYRKNRDSLKSDFAKAAAAHPVISGAANMVGTGAALSAAGPAAMTAGGLAATGAAMGLGASPADLTKGEVGRAAMDTAVGAGTNLVAGKAMEAAAPYLGKAMGGVAGYFGDKAENLAEQATGATGKQAAQFKEGTGRELLDRGIVKFGSSPGDIAENANAAMQKSGENISDILENQLPGVTVDRNTVLNYIKNKIRSLSGDESQADLVRSLRSKMGDIEDQISTTTEGATVKPPEMVGPDFSGIPKKLVKNPSQLADAVEGSIDQAHLTNLDSANAAGFDPYGNLPTVTTQESTVPISQAEEIKRGYQSKVNWKSPNPDVVANNANTTVSDAYRQAVEDAATEANPDVAAQFKADKETYGLLSPVAEAAEKRALTLQQSPHGGLHDIAAVGTGGAIGTMIGGPMGTIIGGGIGLGAKALRPRFASAAAVTADQISKVVAASPAVFEKFAPALSAAAARGGVSLGATDYILQQTSQDYRDVRSKIFNENKE